MCRFVWRYGTDSVATCSEWQWQAHVSSYGVSGVECVVGVVPEVARG